MFPFLSENLTRLGFHCAFLPKRSSPCLEQPENGGPDGCALVWSDSLRAVRLDALNLMDGQFSSVTPTAAITELSVPTSSQADQKAGRVAIVGTFASPEHPTNSFRVVVTHLKAKPQCKDIRAAEGILFSGNFCFCVEIRFTLDISALTIAHGFR